MQTGSGSGEAMADINVTPLVDVMLVLLIIFMIVTPALMAGFQATLPTGTNLKSRPDDEKRVTLGIDAQGFYHIDDVPGVIAPEDLAQSLRQQYATRSPDDHVLYLKADNSVEYSVVLTAIDAARVAGVRRIGAITEVQGSAVAGVEEN